MTQRFHLMSAVDLPETTGGEGAPEWVHILPAGRIETYDGRGPYELVDAQAVIDASMGERGDLEIDENHASFLAAPKGGEAPARGWIKEMQAREDGIWGRVEWTAKGTELVASRAYRRISPVVVPAVVNGIKRVTKILNVALVNRNNMRGLAALNFAEGEHPMTMEEVLKKLKATLGLPADCEEDEMWSSLNAVTNAARAEKAAQAGAGAVDPDMQAALSEIGEALGCEAGAEAQVIVTAAKAVGGSEQAIADLQSELVGVTNELNTLKNTTAREAAESFVDGAIKAGRVGVKPRRDRFIDMHMADPAATEDLIAGLPVLDATRTREPVPPRTTTAPELNAEQTRVAELLGLTKDAYKAQLDLERARREEAL